MIKSPLRYPGGKSRAITRIMSVIPHEFGEYREPFVGGGSLFIALRQRYPTIPIWINDLNPELYHFWKYAQKDSETLAREIQRIHDSTTDGQALFHELLNIQSDTLTACERAVRFFVLNRITFSGVVESGGYSRMAFRNRFTPSSIERVARLGSILENITITHFDYRALLSRSGREVFTFLDPPYLKATKSRLYGKKGMLHTQFDHNEFARQMQRCDHTWLITYDDAPEIRANFAFAHMLDWELQYGMNNYKQGKAEKGTELFIANYALPLLLGKKHTNNTSAQLKLGYH